MVAAAIVQLPCLPPVMVVFLLLLRLAVAVVLVLLVFAIKLCVVSGNTTTALLSSPILFLSVPAFVFSADSLEPLSPHNMQ